MAKRDKRRKIKTAAELQAEAEQRMRDTLITAGVPEHRVAGSGVKSFAVASFTDIHHHRSERRSVLRVLYPSIVDRWLADGGPGFEEPQRRAIAHCRELWHQVGSQGSLVANLNWVGGGDSGRERGLAQSEALAQLAQYESRIPRHYWATFENIVRNEWGAGKAAEAFADRPNERLAHARNSVGFVASLIAMWRGF